MGLLLFFANTHQGIHGGPTQARQQSDDHPDTGTGIAAPNILIDPDRQQNVDDQATQHEHPQQVVDVLAQRTDRLVSRHLMMLLQRHLTFHHLMLPPFLRCALRRGRPIPLRGRLILSEHSQRAEQTTQ